MLTLPLGQRDIAIGWGYTIAKGVDKCQTTKAFAWLIRFCDLGMGTVGCHAIVWELGRLDVMSDMSDLCLVAETICNLGLGLCIW